MSAKRIPTILLVTIAQCALVCIASSTSAAPLGEAANAPAGATAKTPLTREDVDLILREARGAIQQGRLAEAEKLVERAEGAHIHYSVFHVGPTPTTVRRELARAERSNTSKGRESAAGDSAGMSRFLPFARASKSEQTTASADPFAGRSKSVDGPAPLPSATRLPSTTGEGDSLQAVPPRGEPAGNPFSDSRGDLDTSGSPSRYPVTQASSGDDSWSLPNAPMPTGYAESRSAPSTPSGLVPPRYDRASGALQSGASGPKQEALAKLNAAREALDAGDLELAEELSRAASELNVPESQFLPNEDRPSLVAWDIVRARQSSPSQPAAARAPESLKITDSSSGSRYDAEPVNSQGPAMAPASEALPGTTSASSAMAAAALAPAGEANDGSLAPETLTLANDVTPVEPAEEGPLFAPSAPAAATAPLRIALAPQSVNEELPGPDNAAAGTANEVAPPATIAAEAEAPAEAGAAPNSLIDSADAEQQVLAKQLSAEVSKRQSEALKLLEKDPERAQAVLHDAQKIVKDSKLPESAQRDLLIRIDITLQKTEKYIKANSADIALNKQNEKALAKQDRDRDMNLKRQQKMAELIEQFNDLRDEQRYGEMEVVARRLIELAPEDPIAQQTWQQAKFIRREMINRELADARENGAWEQWNSVEESLTNPVARDGEEMKFDQKYWEQFAKNRKGSKDRVERRSERELDIERRMKTPVLLRYEETPLSQVADSLSQLTGINIHLDPRGLTQEGHSSDTPITISLAQEISLKSALHLILEPLHLSYVIDDEVLKITSEQLRDGEIYAYTYNVADLVTPIPNFVPSNNIGLQGLINDATHASLNRGNPLSGAEPSVLVNDRRPNSASATDQVLAQQFNAAPGSGGMSPSTVPIGAGPGGMGGAANADFDSLIDLIVSTVQTDTWAENGGGEAEIRPFPTNLSLVISQTQAVHEEIADLLAQLRRLQDLQVTIEVRFIRLNDNFFERIGVDFDMDVNDNGYNGDPLTTDLQPFGPRSNTVGAVRAVTGDLPVFTSDLDIPFRQDSFAATQVLPFGGQVQGGLNFGFAILSDLEAYFLIEAAQGDARTNVLNAPKVTLFNGQQAFVADATQRPFVVGVIPVVGEFAAAQQPVIVVLNEGTMMTIQAVVSDDRRYVRMTIVPFFTQIGDVDTFTFEGSSSSTSSSSSSDDDDDGKKEEESEEEEESRSGVTVQLPSFSFVSVVTTVSVPDGGTVLLGGIKRLSEGRSEFGVPLLSKVPYINRLFRNVSLQRNTESLMMMVTPRIIIQEEEEERLGVAIP